MEAGCELGRPLSDSRAGPGYSSSSTPQRSHRRAVSGAQLLSKGQHACLVRDELRSDHLTAERLGGGEGVLGAGANYLAIVPGNNCGDVRDQVAPLHIFTADEHDTTFP